MKAILIAGFFLKTLVFVTTILLLLARGNSTLSPAQQQMIEAQAIFSIVFFFATFALEAFYYWKQFSKIHPTLKTLHKVSFLVSLGDGVTLLALFFMALHSGLFAAH